MPVSLDEAVKGIGGDWLGVLEERKSCDYLLAEHLCGFFHLFVSVGWNIDEELPVDLSSCIILQPIQQNPQNPKTAGQHSRIRPTMISNLICLHFQRPYHVSSQRRRQPNPLVIQCPRVQAEKSLGVAYSFLKELQIMTHMSTSALLITFSNHHASWQTNALFLKRLYGQNRGISRISIVSSSPPIKLTVNYLGNCRAEPLHPTFERRLFIKMSIKEKRLRQLTFDLRKNEWRVTWIFDDFAAESLNCQTFNPFLDVLGCFFKFTISIPLSIVEA